MADGFRTSLPRYNGENTHLFSAWLMAVVNHTQDLPMARRLQLILASLDGVAMARYQMQGMNRAAIQDEVAGWNDNNLSMYLSSIFSCQETAMAREERFIRLKAGNSIEAYLNKFAIEMAYNVIEIPMIDQIRYFLTGLARGGHYVMVSTIEAQNPGTLQQTIHLAQRYQRMMSGGGATQHSAPSAAGGEAAMDLGAVRQPTGRSAGYGQGGHQRGGAGGYQGGGGQQPTLTCWNCGRKCHKKGDCSQPPQPRYSAAGQGRTRRPGQRGGAFAVELGAATTMWMIVSRASLINAYNMSSLNHTITQ